MGMVMTAPLPPEAMLQNMLGAGHKKTTPVFGVVVMLELL